MKTLVTSASAKLPLLRAVAAHLAGDVVAGDRDPRCVAAYAWPSFWQMPDLDANSVRAVTDAIVEMGFDLVIPTRDAELALLAQQRERLAGAGVAVLVSAPEAIARCQDKLMFAQVLHESGLPAIPTWTIESIPTSVQASLVVKERTGAGSRGLALDVDRTEAMAVASTLVEPVVQPFIAGPEVSVDAYRSRAGRTLGLVARTRDVVVGGESQVTTTIDPTPFAALIAEVLDVLDIQGHAVIQLIRNEAGPLIVECNPRVGGASTLAFAAGLRTFEWFAAEARGEDPASISFEPAPIPLQLIRAPQDVIGAPRL